MEINGVKYLDANDYYRIVITEEEDLKINVNGKILYPIGKLENSISGILKDKTNPEVISYIVDYFLNYNKICSLEDNVNYRYKRYIKVSSPRAELLLKILPTKENKEILKRIFNKFKYDRSKLLYNNEYDRYIIKISNDKTGYYNENFDGRNEIYITLHFQYLDSKNYDISSDEKEFIESFIKYKLDNKNSKSQVTHGKLYFPQFKNFLESEPCLLCEELIITSRVKIFTKILEKISSSHNNELDNINKKQLKLEGF